MVVFGIDAHKRTHTVVAVDETGRKLGENTLGTTTADHLALLTWAE
jgi:transposase